VKAGCTGKHAPDGIIVLPLNVTTDIATLEKGATAAMEAFGSGDEEKGIQYLVHNAGKEYAADLMWLSTKVYTLALRSKCQ
jgi:hypothetical protein